MDLSTYPAPGSTVIDMALAMAEAGYPVAPVRITLRADGRKSPDYGGLSWSTVSTTDPAVIRRWFGPGGRYAGWSYLVDCGKAGITVIDLDTTNGHDGPGAWKALGGLSSIMSVRSRAGGFHGYYRADPEVPLYNSTSAVADGVDVRGIGGCVFGPGSFVEGTDQAYRLLSPAPIPVDRLPMAPAQELVAAMTSRGRTQHLADTAAQHIQREQAYANLVAAVDAMLATPIGYGLNTAIWRVGAEAGQYGAALDADELTVLTWVHQQVVRHPQIEELDGDDHRASQRGVTAGMERPWIFFTLQDLIAKDFDAAGLAVPSAGRTGLASRTHTLAEMAARPAPPPLIDGLIDIGKLAMIYGPGGSGKSFVALDMACAVATGRPWRGRAVRAGSVLYVAGEGASGSPERVRAWAVSHDVPEPDIDVVDGAVDLVGQINPHDVADLAAMVADRGYSLVVLDTYNRCTPGLEENSAKETGMVVTRLAQVQAAGAAVMIVHHTPKDGGTPRGSAALEWATDHALRVEKKESSVVVTNHRQKDRSDGDAFSLVLVAVNGTQSAALVDGIKEALPVVEPAFDPFVAVAVGDDLEYYTGPGERVIPELCKLMAQRAADGVGISRAEAAKALGRNHADGSLRTAWNVLYVRGALRTAVGTHSPTSRCLWVPPGEQRHAVLVTRDTS